MPGYLENKLIKLDCETFEVVRFDLDFEITYRPNDFGILFTLLTCYRLLFSMID